jgi:putative transposase
MEQQARNMTMEQWGCLRGCRHLLHDRDTKFCESFRELIESGSVKPIRLPARSPNLNSYAERWVRSVKEECLAKLILFGESSLRRALQQYLLHYHEERNIRAKTIGSCFLRGRRQGRTWEQCGVENDWGAC